MAHLFVVPYIKIDSFAAVLMVTVVNIYKIKNKEINNVFTQRSVMKL